MISQNAISRAHEQGAQSKSDLRRKMFDLCVSVLARPQCVECRIDQNKISQLDSH